MHKLAVMMSAAGCVCLLMTGIGYAQEGAAGVRRHGVEDGLRAAVRFEGEKDATYSMEQGLARHGVPGLGIAIIRNGRLDWAAGYGRLEAGGDQPVTGQTRFQAGSLSKPVTVFAVLRMREAGVIDFDRDIHDYLRDFALPEGAHSADNPVTFRNLLAHTSGVVPGGYAGYPVDADIPSDIETLSGSPPAETDAVTVVAAPGTRLAYSGPAYTIAELALQDVTGRPFAALMADWVFEPLEMRQSTFEQPLPPALEDTAARGHRPDGTPVPGGWRVHPEQAAGGLWATAGDLAKFLIAVNDARNGESGVLSRDSAQELFTEQMDGHAYGFILNGEGDSLSIRHFGGNEGYRAMMILYPETGNGGVFLSSSDNGFALVTPVLRSVSAVYDWPDFRQVSVSRMKLEQATLQRYAGTYRFEGGVQVDVTYSVEENAISVRFPNGDVYPLVPTGAADFIHVETGVTVNFDGPDRIILYGDTGTRVAP